MSPPRAEVEPTAYHRRTAGRCSGMDSTGTARRLLGHGAVSRPYAQLTGGHVANTPIYAELVAEWRAKGQTVPGHREGLWASFAVVTAGDRGPTPAVPFHVPVPLLAPEVSVRASGGTSEDLSGEPPSRGTPEGTSSGVICEETSGTMPLRDSSEETSGEAPEEVSEGRPSQETPGAAPSGEPSEGTSDETSGEVSERSPSGETRETVPCGVVPEDVGEGRPSSGEALDGRPSREMPEGTSSGKTPGTASYEAAVHQAAAPEQAPEPQVTSSPDPPAPR